jgi:muramoyltetrapeptide carboxypeptidase
MPGSPLWQNGATVKNLIDLLSTGWGGPWSGDLKLSPVAGSRPITGPIAGQLFGGCLSVLSNLIGTRYLPQRFSRHILFFEDTGETAPRILRDWRQWLDSGLLTGVRAVVFGQFTECFRDPAEVRWLLAELAERTPCPVFVSTDFGHIENNAPIGIGAEATIDENELKWHF